MNVRTPSTRRDRRYALRQDCATLEFADPTCPAAPRKMPLITISASGLEFRVEDGTAAPSPGSHLDSVTLRIGDCVLEGAAVVRSNWTMPAGGVEVGCLFYPGDSANEERLVIFLAGADAAQPD